MLIYENKGKSSRNFNHTCILNLSLHDRDDLGWSRCIYCPSDDQGQVTCGVVYSSSGCSSF
jgi:hypothetical protein